MKKKIRNRFYGNQKILAKEWNIILVMLDKQINKVSYYS